MRRILWAIALGITITAGNAAPARADRVGNQLSLQRNELTTEYRQASKQLEDVEESIDESTDTSAISGTALAVRELRNTQREHIRKLENRRSDLRKQISEILRDYKSLTRKAEDHYGELPMWWDERLD